MNETEPKQPAALAAMLSKASGRTITVEDIAADVNDGAPVNADGSMSLVDYTAWLLKATANGKAG